jgi:type II secretory pathway component PulF
MPVYRYRAVDTAGDVATGELEAANESEIVDRLRDRGMLPMQVAPAVGGAPSAAVARDAAKTKARGGVFGLFVPKTVTRDQLLALTRELATLMRAGLPLDRALEVLDRARRLAAGRVAAAADSRRRARRQVAVAGTRRATRRVLAVLREHRARR